CLRRLNRVSSVKTAGWPAVPQGCRTPGGSSRAGCQRSSAADGRRGEGARRRRTGDGGRTALHDLYDRGIAERQSSKIAREVASGPGSGGGPRSDATGAAVASVGSRATRDHSGGEKLKRSRSKAAYDS